MKGIARIATVGLVAALALAACGGAGTSVASAEPHPKVDGERAREMATVALTGLNEGDYAKWSRDWSETMKAALGPDAFHTVRQDTLARYGVFVSIDGVTLSRAKTAGFVKYAFTVSFANGRQVYSIVLAETGERIEGVRLDPAA